MNQYTATRIQAGLDESYGRGEVFEEILIIDIVNGDLMMLKRREDLISLVQS